MCQLFIEREIVLKREAQRYRVIKERLPPKDQSLLSVKRGDMDREMRILL